jgi:hypothetical protein
MADIDRSHETAPGYRRNEVVATQEARFGGVKVGSAFFGWLTATGLAVLLTIAVVVAAVALVAGNEFNVLGSLNGFPRIPVDEGTLTTGGIVALVVAALVTLVGAILGGKAGMRYHRRVDDVVVERDVAAPVRYDDGRPL